MSDDPAQEYFSDGLTEEIITDLSHIKGLRVISRTSTMQLKGTEKNLKTIGRELNVKHILEGSVRKSGNNLRIIAQLIDTTTDEHIWAEKYDGTLKDVFDIQEKVSRSIVDALKLQLSPEEDKKIAEHPIENVHAYEFYFRAKKTFGTTEEHALDKGCRDVQSGLDLVGDNELLYACKGRIYWQYVYAGIKGEEYLAKAEECCNKIFDLNPESQYGHYLLAIIEYKRGNINKVFKHTEKVLGTDPNNTDPLKWFQDYDVQSAKNRDSALLEKKLLEIDPLTSFDEYSLQVRDFLRGETRDILHYIKKPIVLTSIIFILLLSLFLGWYINRNAKIRWAKEQAIPEIEQLSNEMNYTSAYQIAVKAEKFIPKNHQLIQLISQVSSYISIQTDPPGADIYAKEYTNIESDWKFLGQSPIDSLRLPDIFYRWKIEKEGFESVMAVARVRIDTLFRKLDLKGAIPPGMVRVVGRNTNAGKIPDFFIDKYEVTNQRFKEFLDAEGYQNQEYWKHDFVMNGRVLTWEEAMVEFRDASGRPGPSTWQAGDYPEGQDDYPVSGVSWYEAAAYAEFVGESLPTVQHWGIACRFNLPSNWEFPSL
jgi:TolB-like protein